MRRARASILVVCALPLGCNDTSHLAPPSPETPWTIPAAAAPTPAELPAMEALPEFQVDRTHFHTLPELIDIAERRNPGTRVAWEQARQAATNVGIAQAAYLPVITASALGGFQRVALPFPSSSASRGYITANSEEILPTLAITYLLFDFGGRDAATQAARQLSIAANINFTGAHQKLIFEVARAYFSLQGADAAVRAAQQGLKDAQALQSSTEALFDRGLDTIVSVQLARRATAQRKYELDVATAAQHEAAYGLLAAMSLPPTTQIRVGDITTRPLPPRVGAEIQPVLNQALQQRPDLMAAVARLRASDAGIAEARAAFRPKLSLDSNIQLNIGQISVDGSPYHSIMQPQAGVFLQFRWPIYEGGVLEHRLAIAKSRHDAAADALQETRDRALHEVALACDKLDTSLQQYDAAVALRTAAQTAFDSATDAYAHGVGSFTDAVSAESALAGARAAVAGAHAQALINAAGLAFATGALTSSNALQAMEPGGGLQPGNPGGLHQIGEGRFGNVRNNMIEPAISVHDN